MSTGIIMTLRLLGIRLKPKFAVWHNTSLFHLFFYISCVSKPWWDRLIDFHEQFLPLPMSRPLLILAQNKAGYTLVSWCYASHCWCCNLIWVSFLPVISWYFFFVSASLGFKVFLPTFHSHPPPTLPPSSLPLYLSLSYNSITMSCYASWIEVFPWN